MADQLYIAIPTEVGLVKIQQAMYTQSTLEITSMAYGDGGGEYYYPSPDQTSLRNELGLTSIQSMKVDTDMGVTWFYAIIGAHLPSGIIREVGLYDSEGSLIFIANTPDIAKVPTEEGTLVDVPIELGIKNSYSQYITIPISPSSDYASMTWVYDNFANINLDNISPLGKNKIKQYGEGPVLWEDYPGGTIEGRTVVLRDKDTNEVLIPFGTGGGGGVGIRLLFVDYIQAESPVPGPGPGGDDSLIFVDYIDIELPIPVPPTGDYVYVSELIGYDDQTGERTNLHPSDEPGS